MELYYGGLAVKIADGKYYWGIKDYDNYDKFYWCEIPETLYKALINYEEDRQKQIEECAATN